MADVHMLFPFLLSLLLCSLFVLGIRIDILGRFKRIIILPVLSNVLVSFLFSQIVWSFSTHLCLVGYVSLHMLPTWLGHLPWWYQLVLWLSPHFPILSRRYIWIPCILDLNVSTVLGVQGCSYISTWIHCLWVGPYVGGSWCHCTSWCPLYVLVNQRRVQMWSGRY